MPATRGKDAKTSYSRVFTIDGGAGPANAPVYQGRAKAGAVSWDQGGVTPVRVPSPDAYDRFDVVDSLQAQQGLPMLPLTFRMGFQRSAILDMVKRGCDVDVQVHLGKCGTPTDFNGGWNDGKVIVLETAKLTTYGTGELGALDSDERAMIDEDVDSVGLDYYEVYPVTPSEQAASLITDEVVDVAICDSVTCASCGLPSDGCQVIFALVGESSGSPGIAASVVWSKDGGANWAKSVITSMGLSETGLAIDCVGTDLVVLVGGATGGIHYIPIADITAGLAGWTKVATGFVLAAGAPNDLYSASPTQTWIAGNGGYLYFTSDIRSGVTVQSAGAVTAQNLTRIHGFDDQNIVAVGAANALVSTQNGGSTWSLITGPAPAVALSAINMRRLTEWVVGSAAGNLYYTRDRGATWTLKAFAGSAAGVVRDVVFATPTVGYLSHDTAAPLGRVFRTIDGGYSWFTLPQKTGSFPTNRRINRIAACRASANVAYAGGLFDANDGILVKLA